MTVRQSVLLLGWGFLCLILFLSLSRSGLTNQIWESTVSPYISYAWWSRLQHFIAYGILMLWAGLAFPAHKVRASLLLIALGIILEIGQYFLPYRSFDWLDLLLGTAGIITVLFTFLLFSRLQN